MMVLRITSPYFVAGITVDGGLVERAAPILKYMLGWPMHRVQTYCESRYWKCEVFHV